MEYRPEIDGLRAVAVVPVILFHAGFRSFAGGFVGVDVFFVISGYLITTIILADMDKGAFSLATFYERRARRILPALFAVILCCLPFAWLWLLPDHLEDFGESMTAVATFSSNVLFWQESGYFDTAAELKPLLHTWSLAVEEQYYVLFPIFLMALWRWPRRWMLGALLAVGAASVALAQWAAYNAPAAAFFLLPTRGWEIAIGAMIAFFSLHRRSQARVSASGRMAGEVGGGVGLALICYAVVAFDKTTPFPGAYALVPTMGAALVIVFATSQTVVGRVLSTKWLVGVGLISYSAYLWHQPLFAFARQRSLVDVSVPVVLALSVLALLLGYLTWRFVERPFRDKRAFTRRRIFAFGVVGSAVLAATGVVAQSSDGLDQRTNGHGTALGDIASRVRTNYGLDRKCDGAFTLSPKCRTGDRPDILVWGDSYAMQLVQGLLASGPPAQLIQMTKTACGPMFDVAPVFTREYNVKWAEGCLAFNSEVRQWLTTNKTVRFAVLSSPFWQYMEDGQLLIDGRLHDASMDVAAEYLHRTLNELKGMGITPVVFSPTPQDGNNIGQCLVKAEFFGVDVTACDFSREDVTERSEAVYAWLARIAETENVVFLSDGMCRAGKCLASMDGTFIYRDKGHLSQEGSAFLGKRMGFRSLVTGVP